MFPFALPTLAHAEERATTADYFFDNTRRSTSPYVILQQTLSGVGMFCLGRKKHPVSEGELFIALVPEPSRYYFDPAKADHWKFRWINLSGRSAVSMWGEFRRDFGPVARIPQGTTAYQELGRLIDDVEHRKLPSLSARAEAAHSVFVTCWQQLSGRTEALKDPVVQLRELIESRFHEPVNLKELSAEIGQSREHLTRQFKIRFGTEPAAYLRRLRHRHAEMFLERSALPIGEIARRSGYSSSGQLVRSFTQLAGVSPGAWRKTVSQNRS
jgi:AraC-like DNA-binding protein